MTDSPLKTQLKQALQFSKSKKYNDAQRLVADLTISMLEPDDLRTLALVHSNCREFAAAEMCWLEIVRRDQAGKGDFFMLSGMQMRLGKEAEAIDSLRAELDICKATKCDAYLSSTAVKLGYLLLKHGQTEEGMTTLASANAEDGLFIQDVGFRNKGQIIQMFTRSS